MINIDPHDLIVATNYNLTAADIRAGVGGIYTAAVHNTARYNVLRQRVMDGDFQAMQTTYAQHAQIMNIAGGMTAQLPDDNPVLSAMAQAVGDGVACDEVLQMTLQALTQWIQLMNAGATQVMGSNALFPNVPLPEVPEVEEQLNE
jgi:hypothetical protein